MTGGFTPGSQYYDSSPELRGQDGISSEIEYTSHQNIFGATVNDGKADAFRKVQAGLDPESLQRKANAWDVINADHSSVASELTAIHQQIFFAAWSGDDADQAEKTFGQTVTSANALKSYSDSMHKGTQKLATAANTAAGTSSGGPNIGSRLAGGLGFGGGDGDGDADMKAYGQLCQDVSDGRGQMPSKVEWQNKTDTANQQQSTFNPNAASPNGVGGVTSPGASTTPNHLTTRTPNVKPPPLVKTSTSKTRPGTTTTSDPGTEPVDYSPPATSYDSSPYSTSPGGSGLDPSSAGGPSLDSGSSLAGFDPSGAGAGGDGLGGGLSSGGALSGTGGAAGSGLAGGGSLGGGTGTSAGAGTAGTGAGAAGEAGRGGFGGQAAPLRGGGGGGNDESERERSTWLSEDDDVWGESDAPPSVIS